MQGIHKIKALIRSKKGVAVMELAFFIPLAMILLYMIVDMATLFKLKYQIQNLSINVAEDTVALLRQKTTKATLSDFKQIAESVILSLHGVYKEDNYNLYVGWELVKYDGSSYSVEWSGYGAKEGANDVSMTNGSKSNHVWKTKITAMGETRIKDAATLAESYSSSLNTGSNQYVLVVSVVFSQSKSNGWYGISDLTYNAIKNSFSGAFTSQSAILIEDADLLLPPS